MGISFRVIDLTSKEQTRALKHRPTYQIAFHPRDREEYWERPFKPPLSNYFGQGKRMIEGPYCNLREDRAYLLERQRVAEQKLKPYKVIFMGGDTISEPSESSGEMNATINRTIISASKSKELNREKYEDASKPLYFKGEVMDAFSGHPIKGVHVLEGTSIANYAQQKMASFSSDQWRLLNSFEGNLNFNLPELIFLRKLLYGPYESNFKNSTRTNNNGEYELENMVWNPIEDYIILAQDYYPHQYSAAYIFSKYGHTNPFLEENGVRHIPPITLFPMGYGTIKILCRNDNLTITPKIFFDNKKDSPFVSHEGATVRTPHTPFVNMASFSNNQESIIYLPAEIGFNLEFTIAGDVTQRYKYPKSIYLKKGEKASLGTMVLSRRP